MANIPTEDLSNKNLSKPLIRTMEDDLRLLRANPSLKTAAPQIKADAMPKKTSNIAQPQPSKQPVPVRSQAPSDEEKQKAEQLRIQKEKERLAQIEAEKELERMKKKDEEAKKEKEKAERAKKEKEEIEQAKAAEEKAERDRLQKEKERLAQIEAQKELEKTKKIEEELRREKEKAEQLRIAGEEAERSRKAKEKAERERIQKEKERLAQIEAEKELEKIRQREAEFKKEKEKIDKIKKEKQEIENARKAKEKAERDRIKKEQEAAEQAKREEAMMVKKKLSEEIKKEMEEEIIREKEKAEQVRIEMELEIKKEKEAAEQVKRERESAMKKRVAKMIKEEMEDEIAKEKEKAEQAKKELELELKKELEAEIEKEKELEKEIKKEMTIDLRKQIAEELKKDKEKANIKDISLQPVQAKETITQPKSADVLSAPRINSFLKTDESAAKIVDAPHNLPISQAVPVSVGQSSGKAPAAEENKKSEQRLKEEELEIIRKKAEELKKEKEVSEQLKREKEIFTKALKEKEAAEKYRIQKEKEKIMQEEAEKVAGTKKESAPPAANAGNKNIPDYKSAWRDSSLNSKFFANAPQKVSAPVSNPPPVFAPTPASEVVPDFKPASVKPADPVLKKSAESPADIAPKKKISSYSADHPFMPRAEQKKTSGKRYSELSGEYEHLSPEMRLAQQGFSSISSDLEVGMRKDAELLDQDLMLKKRIAASNKPSIPEQLHTLPPPLLEKNLKPESASILKTILKIAVIISIAAGALYGIYYFVFKAAPLINNSPAVQTGQPVLADIKQFEVSLDPSSNAIPAIKEYIKNNPANTEKVSRIIIKNSADGKTLKISDFGTVLGVIIPAKFLDNLSEDYDLVVFNYPEKNYLRMGMVLRFKDAELAASQAQEWESAMTIGTNSLLFDESGFYDNTKSFGSSSYKDYPIKYLPLGKNDLALNYVVDKNKNLFLFATSQEDIYFLIDEVQK